MHIGGTPCREPERNFTTVQLAGQSIGIAPLRRIEDEGLGTLARLPRSIRVLLENLVRHELRLPGARRIWYVADAFRAGYSMDWIYAQSAIDPWFLVQIEDLIRIEQGLASRDLDSLTADEIRGFKRKGFSDRRLADVLGSDELAVGARRRDLGIRPVYKRVDTCAAEFASNTAYMYSSYDEECEADPSTRDKIVVLGGGPNRIGQGIEFDYCCVHAAHWQCGRTVTKPSWSTATRKPCPPITIRQTALLRTR